MAVSGTPKGRRVSGSVRATSSGGARPVGLRGTTRTALPRRGGNPAGPHAGLISGAQRGGKLPGAD